MEKIQVSKVVGGNISAVGTFPLAVRRTKALTDAPQGTSGPVEVGKVETVQIEGKLYRVLPAFGEGQPRRVIMGE